MYGCPMKTYRLTISQDQAHALVRACDALTRIGLGQLDKAVLDNTGHMPNALEGAARAREMLGGVTALLGEPTYGRGKGPSVCSDDIPEIYRNAWDIQQVIRHQLSKDDLPGGYGLVAKADPMRTAQYPLPEIEGVELKDSLDIIQFREGKVSHACAAGMGLDRKPVCGSRPVTGEDGVRQVGTTATSVPTCGACRRSKVVRNLFPF